MPRGGARPGAGRPKKSGVQPAKSTKSKTRASVRAAKAIAAMGASVSDSQNSNAPNSNMDTALDFLRAVWRGEVNPTDAQLKAALGALPFSNNKLPEAGAPGKKATQEETAKEVATGKFAPPKAPQLAVDNTKR